MRRSTPCCIALQVLTGRPALIVDHNLSADPPMSPDDLQAADRVLRHGMPQVAAASGWSDGRYSFYPLVTDPATACRRGVSIRASPDIGKAVMSAIEQTGRRSTACVWDGSPEKARMQAEREGLRSALLSSLSHDLKTPLATILGSVSTLRELASALPEAARNDLLAAIEVDARQPQCLCRRSAHMTRFRPGSICGWIGLIRGDILDAAVARIRRTHPSGLSSRPSIRNCRCPHRLPRCWSMPWFNCLDNANGIAPEGTTITVVSGRRMAPCGSRSRTRGRACPWTTSIAFSSPFSGGRPVRPTEPGLGLAITKGIVQALGGSLGVESPLTPKGGARFWLAFPLSVELPHEIPDRDPDHRR